MDVRILWVWFGVGAWVMGQVVVEEKNELVQMGTAMGLGKWVNRMNWGNNDPCLMNWYGVTCDSSNSTITHISLSNNNLTGIMDFNIGNLPSLVYLDLSKNKLIGSIPDMFSNSSLTYFNVSMNLLNGSIPASLQNASLLSILDMSVNTLNGSIPDLQNLIFLSYLDLSGNKLSGSIPDFQNLLFLSYLDLSYNKLTESIPSFQNNSLLNYLDLSLNGLNGSLPDFTGSSLTHLDLSNNQLMGGIPASIPSSPSLVYLNMANNMFNGTIPNSFPEHSPLSFLKLNLNFRLSGSIPSSLENLTSLTFLDLSYNQLSYPLPDFLIGSSTLLHLILFSNRFNGTIPDTFQSSLLYLDLSSNRFIGNIPPSIKNLVFLTYLSMSNNFLNGTIPNDSLQNLTSLKSLRLSSNVLSGSAPSKIYHLISLTYVDLSSNQLSGAPPAILPNSLISMTLVSNQLSGAIPSFSGPNGTQLTNFTTLKLQGNGLSGISSMNNVHLTYLDISNNPFGNSIWPSIQQLTLLQTLVANGCSFSGTLPVISMNQLISLSIQYSQMNGLSSLNLPSLNNLDISGNKFNGPVPAVFTELTSLTSLDLSYNTFVGPIIEDVFNSTTNLQSLYLYRNSFNSALPSLRFLTRLTTLHCSNNQFNDTSPDLYLPSLQVLDFSSNKLTYFPSSLFSLTSLIYLQLYNNQINMQIPDAINQLTRIQNLNLQNNKINGTIPSTLGPLTSLQTLYLDGNSLSGTIPDAVGLNSALNTLSLSGNSLSGSLPTTFVHLSKLRSLDLSSNKFTEIPEGISALTALISLGLQNNLISSAGNQTLTGLSSLISLYVSTNKMSTFPSAFVDLTSLVYLDISYNYLSGSLPDLYSLSNLQTLGMTNNRFDNLTKLTSLGSLTSLSNLLLNNNQLKGDVPQSFSSLTLLTQISLSFNQLSTIPESLSLATSLGYIDLSSNYLTGSIPSSFSSLTNLYSLTLSTNQFSTIPDQLELLTRLGYLRLPSNRLSGTIPDLRSSLISIYTLDISSNGFSGTLPSSIHDISSLRSISISGNSICDNIYNYCFQFLKPYLSCDVSGFWSCRCSYNCKTTNCQLQYSINTCLENFPEFGYYENGVWIINSTMINMINFFDVTNISGTIIGDLNIASLSIKNATISIAGSLAGSTLHLNGSDLTVQDNLNTTGTITTSVSSTIVVLGNFTSSGKIYLDLQNAIPSSSNMYTLVTSSEPININPQNFVLLHQNPLDCGVLRNRTRSLVYQFDPCPTPGAINSTLIGAVTGSVLFVALLVGVVLYIKQRHAIAKQFKSLRKTATRNMEK